MTPEIVVQRGDRPDRRAGPSPRLTRPAYRQKACSKVRLPDRKLDAVTVNKTKLLWINICDPKVRLVDAHWFCPTGTGAARRGIDLRAAELAAGQFLEALGISLDTESLRDTPGRMARAYAELFTPRPSN